MNKFTSDNLDIFINNKDTPEDVANWFIDYIRRLNPEDENNVSLYLEYFKDMSKEKIKQIIKDIEDGDILPYFSVPFSPMLNRKNLLRIGEELGLELFQPIILRDESTGVVTATKAKHFMTLQICKRLIQHQEEKSTEQDYIPVVDILTNQPTSSTKVTKLTSPELAILNSYGQKDAIYELLSVRGGDAEKLHTMRITLRNSGECSLSQLYNIQSKPMIVETLSKFFICMGIENNL